MTPTQHPITEDDIANFLANTPDFFERHAALLASVELSSGHGSRAISLQERQASMLRDKIKGLETRLVDMIRHSANNEAIASRLQLWTQRLLRVSDPAQVPHAVVQGLIDDLQVPQAALKVWGVCPALAEQPFARGASEDIRTFTASLSAPYCGLNSGFEAVRWLGEPHAAESLALIALRAAPSSGPEGTTPLAGLLVLASPDAQRFQVGMGLEFLVQVGQTASAALSRLQSLGQR